MNKKWYGLIMDIDYNKLNIDREGKVQILDIKLDKQLITSLVDKEGFITLTEKGMAIANHTYEKHKLLSSVLVKLGVSEETAREDACKIEHDLSDETFNAIKNYVEKVKNPR